MLFPAAAILIGVLLLAWGADRLVLGASAAARNLGVSPLLIGLIIVGFATSAPEMLVSALASANGTPGLAVGNALGSNIANLGLVLGGAALVHPLIVRSQTLRREFPALLIATVLTFVLFLDGYLGRGDGLILLAGLGVIIYWIVLLSLRSSASDPIRAEYEAEIPTDWSMLKATIWLVLGLAMLLGGAELMVWGAVAVARAMGISGLVIGLTVVAIGTILPELAVAIAGALKGEFDLVLGNVLGSNFFNLLAVIGICAMILPHEFDRSVLTLHYPVMATLTLATFALAYNPASKSQLSRGVGGALLVVFIAYQGFLAWGALIP